MVDVSKRRRQPKGTPSGGEFAEENKAKGAGDLNTAVRAADDEDDLIDPVALMRMADNGEWDRLACADARDAEHAIRAAAGVDGLPVDIPVFAGHESEDWPECYASDCAELARFLDELGYEDRARGWRGEYPNGYEKAFSRRVAAAGTLDGLQQVYADCPDDAHREKTLERLPEICPAGLDDYSDCERFIHEVISSHEGPLTDGMIRNLRLKPDGIPEDGLVAVNARTLNAIMDRQDLPVEEELSWLADTASGPDWVAYRPDATPAYVLASKSGNTESVERALNAMMDTDWDGAVIASCMKSAIKTNKRYTPTRESTRRLVSMIPDMAFYDPSDPDRLREQTRIVHEALSA